MFAGVIDDSKLDVDFLYFFIIRDYQSYLIEENNTNDKRILELVHQKLSGVPLLEICRVVILEIDFLLSLIMQRSYHLP